MKYQDQHWEPGLVQFYQVSFPLRSCHTGEHAQIKYRLKKFAYQNKKCVASELFDLLQKY